jgi:hypothetical protein
MKQAATVAETTQAGLNFQDLFRRIHANIILACSRITQRFRSFYVFFSAGEKTRVNMLHATDEYRMRLSSNGPQYAMRRPNGPGILLK